MSHEALMKPHAVVRLPRALPRPAKSQHQLCPSSRPLKRPSANVHAWQRRCSSMPGALGSVARCAAHAAAHSSTDLTARPSSNPARGGEPTRFVCALAWSGSDADSKAAASGSAQWRAEEALGTACSVRRALEAPGRREFFDRRREFFDPLNRRLGHSFLQIVSFGETSRLSHPYIV